jgi:hypothetical protein
MYCPVLTHCSGSVERVSLFPLGRMDTGLPRRVVALGACENGRAVEEVGGVRQVVCTHQLGLLVVRPSSEAASSSVHIFIHSSDFVDVEGGNANAEAGATTQNKDYHHLAEERSKKRQRVAPPPTGRAATPACPLPRLRFNPPVQVVQVVATWAHALLLDGACPAFATSLHERALIDFHNAEAGAFNAVQRWVERLRPVRHGRLVHGSLNGRDDDA